MVHIDGRDLAYTAGIIDGEGCIRTNNSRANSSSVHVKVSNTDKRLVDWLHKLYGGCIYVCKKRNPAHKQCYQWLLQGKQAAEFLTLVQPYLFLKLEQSMLALQFQTTVRPTRGGPPISAEIRATRAILIDRMAQLNRKGEHHAAA